MTFSDSVKQGDHVQLRKGREWLSITACFEYDDNNEAMGYSSTKALWVYGKNKTGTDRCIRDMDVLNSQLQAHLEHGWELVK